MSYKRLILIGDSHFRGDGAEWPKLYGHLGPIPNQYRGNIWSNKIKTATSEELAIIHRQFYQDLGDKLNKHADQIIELRKTLGFGNQIAKHEKLEYENYCLNTSDISEILPFFKFQCNDLDLRNSLVLLGVPPAISNLTYQKEGERLKNISVSYIAQQIMFIKEFIENRGGHMLYMHTEDFPEQVYNPELNPYYIDLMPLLIHEGNLQSLLSNSYYWKKHDGRPFDASVHKQLGVIIGKKVAEMQ